MDVLVGASLQLVVPRNRASERHHERCGGGDVPDLGAISAGESQGASIALGALVMGVM